VSRAADIQKLDRYIKDCEIRLSTFKVNATTIKKEIDFLMKVEEQLQGNITFLKKIKIVTLAEEYKKAKEDLKRIKTKLTQLKSDEIINERAQKEILFLIEKNKEAYDKLIRQDENNVLQGKFGRKRD
jgi:hypothetical protein